MDTVLTIIMILLSVVLMIVVLLQTKGSSFSGAFGGDSGSIYRTRRGFEKTLFQSTIVLSVIWVIFAILVSFT
ncbi:MAG: preprotein translocase subunit SecG [Thermomicrobiales bacterium]|jgi:preprotein translocase subunit SecG|nr:preprotein translocase subunit SecG [Thermomicrobiales bacterium]